MTSKQEAIKKLNKKFNGKFSIQVQATSSGMNGVQGATALVQILEPQPEKAPLVVRYSNAFGFAPTLDEAQDKAVITAIENLGL